MSSVVATARPGVLAAGAVAVLALAACGQPSSTANTASAGASAPVGAPPELTDAQKKALVATLPAAYQGADLSNGEAKFAICRSCHTLPEGGEDMTGPNLWGVFGRKAGSKPGFSYSDELAHAGWTWDADHLDKWITNPHAVLPDTTMTFIGMPSATDRRDVIAFLKVQTSPAPKS
jgi:cytochrome c